MKRFGDWLIDGASGARVLAVLGAFLVMFATFGWVLDPPFQAASRGELPIDMSPDKSVGTIYAQLAHYTDRSREIYRWFFLLDFVYPPTLALLFATLWAWLARRAGAGFPRRWLANRIWIVPFVAAVLDWTENVGFLALIERNPERLETVAAFAAWTNYTKLGILAGCFLLTLLYAGAALMPRPQGN